jgi:uncharacterized protein YdhG (YjbR/CyaY superfamily)
MKKLIIQKNVDNYLSTVSQDSRKALKNLRKAIKSAAPKAEEVISYKIPFFKYHGPLVCFAAFANHCSFYVVNKSILKTFSTQLKPFHTSGTTIHFSPEHPLPAALVKKIVKARIKQNEARHKSKISCK